MIRESHGSLCALSLANNLVEETLNFKYPGILLINYSLHTRLRI